MEVFSRLPNYCILHGWQGLPEHLPSDLDIAIAPEALRELESALLRTEEARLVNLLQHETTCYYFVLALREGEQVRFLAVDAAVDYRRDGRVWFSADELLVRRRRWKEFWVAAPDVEFKYLLVKKILKQSVPRHAADRLQGLTEELGPKADEEAQRLLGRTWGPKALEWVRRGEWGTLERHLGTLKKVLKRERLKQDPLNPLRYWLPELGRIWRRWHYPTGLWVAVLGPDGAGKSTLIQGLRVELAGAFRRTETFHLTPALLRKGGDSGPVTEPHGKPPRSLPGSLLKLAYYWLVYTLGYWLKVRPVLVRSTLVLFDRYYDDSLIDPRRYRYGGPMCAVRWLRRFIPRPDLFLVLDVPVEKLRERKQEVEPEELRRQVEAYRRFALSTPNAMLMDGSQRPEEVIRQAKEIILAYLRARYLSRRSIWLLKTQVEEEREYLYQAFGAALPERKEGKQFLHLALPDGRGYLLPVNSRRSAISSLSLYTPQKLGAKLVKRVLQAGLKTNLAQRWLPKVNLDLWDLEEHLAEIFGRRDLSLAISLGTPGPHRKPVVQVMTQEGDVLGYVKVGLSEETRRLVENEALVLRRLKEKNLPFVFPRLLFAGEWKGHFLCIQSPPPPEARPAPSKWCPLYEEAMRGMASLGVKRQRLEESIFWKHLTDRAARIAENYLRHVVERSIEQMLGRWGDVALPFHPAHGDFTPWNALSVAGSLYLYDWEYASEETPAGYDAFHLVVQKALLVERKAPIEILNTAKEHLGRAEAYWKAIGVDESAWSVSLGLYLLDRLTFLNFYQGTVRTKRDFVVLLYLWDSMGYK